MTNFLTPSFFIEDVNYLTNNVHFYYCMVDLYKNIIILLNNEKLAIAFIIIVILIEIIWYMSLSLTL